ncbi:hypothetical protein Ciccas_014619 [Cichlidogyrus casuarinus]|uniref:Uncharacterized protein n=1 Tax=Cichlidogyrus casuarinus TaxID=1844966 RepID=A0ABD2PI12_9PLAT
MIVETDIYGRPASPWISEMQANYVRPGDTDLHFPYHINPIPQYVNESTVMLKNKAVPIETEYNHRFNWPGNIRLPHFLTK